MIQRNLLQKGKASQVRLKSNSSPKAPWDYLRWVVLKEAGPPLEPQGVLGEGGEKGHRRQANHPSCKLTLNISDHCRTSIPHLERTLRGMNIEGRGEVLKLSF